MSSGRTICSNYRHCLLRAATEGQELVVQRLSENAAELEAKDNLGRTPLVRTAEKGHEAVVKLLLSRDDVVILFNHGHESPP